MTKYFLRTCSKDGTSYGGFQWPLEAGGIAEAPDWKPSLSCGYGLHGLLDGYGDGALLNWDQDALWYVCEALGPIVNIGNKIKTSKAKVLFVSGRKEATDFLMTLDGIDPSKVVGAFIAGGDRSTVTGGNGSTVTGGNGSTVTGGDYSTVTGGYESKVTGGAGSTVTGGNWSTVTGGDRSTVTCGNWSTVTGGYESKVTGGYGSTVTGNGGSILNVYYYGHNNKLRLATAYVGEDGIEPSVRYKVDKTGKFYVLS